MNVCTCVYAAQWWFIQCEWWVRHRENIILCISWSGDHYLYDTVNIWHNNLQQYPG